MGEIRKTVSIIVPVRNEEKNIGTCITNIVSNDYPGNLVEILIVDGESNDNTREVVKKFAEKNPNIRLLSNPKRTPYSGLNIGLGAAQGEIIMRVDARSIIPENYISMCVETLDRTRADNVGGVQRQIGSTPAQKAIALATGHPFGVGDAQFRMGKRSGYTDTVYLGCFQRDLFDRIGVFDEDGPVISEDSALNRRIIDSGGKVYLNKDIIVKYPAKESLGALFKQYFIYGGAKAHIVLKYGKFTAWRQPLLLLFFLTLFLSLAGTVLSRWSFLMFLCLFGSYLAADLFVSLGIALKRATNISVLPFLMAAFPVIHLGYFLGFVVRIVEGKNPASHWRK